MKKVCAVLLGIMMILLSACSAASGEASAAVKPGDILTFGQYHQTDAGTDRVPIEWLVLEVQDGKAFLVSRYGVDTGHYDVNGKFAWEECGMRSWLNSTFMQEAFSEQEAAAILVTEVDNSTAQGYSEWQTKDGADTQDKLFLLSFAEADRYFGPIGVGVGNGSVSARIRPPEFAIKSGLYKASDYTLEDGTGTGWWWLRSPGRNNTNVAYVDYDGSLDSLNGGATGCVRPAFWLDLAAAGLYGSTPSESFTFRGGITWGMSREEVTALEKEASFSEIDLGNYLSLSSSGPVRLSRYEANLAYLFSGDTLVMAAYGINESSPEVSEGLKQAYDTKYGEEQEASVEVFYGLLQKTGALPFSEEDIRESTLYRWDAAGGTQVWMVLENESLVILYVSPEALADEPAIDMTGI